MAVKQYIAHFKYRKILDFPSKGVTSVDADTSKQSTGKGVIHIYTQSGLVSQLAANGEPGLSVGLAKIGQSSGDGKDNPRRDINVDSDHYATRHIS